MDLLKRNVTLTLGSTGHLSISDYPDPDYLLGLLSDIEQAKAKRVQYSVLMYFKPEHRKPILLEVIKRMKTASIEFEVQGILISSTLTNEELYNAMNESTIQPITLTPQGFAPAAEPTEVGWTAYPNQTFGFYDGQSVQPGLISYLSGAEAILYLCLMRLTDGYHRTWTRISLSNLQELTGLSRNSVMSAAKNLQAKSINDKEKDSHTVKLIETNNDGGVLLWRVCSENIALFLTLKQGQITQNEAKELQASGAKIEPNWRENRAEVARKSRQSGAKIEPPTRKEIKEREQIQTNTCAREISLSDISDDLGHVMATALGLDLRIKANVDCINLTVKKLQGLYTSEVTASNLLKVCHEVLARFGASPKQVFNQWQAILAQTAPTPIEAKAEDLANKIDNVTNRIKEICKPPSALGWSHKSVKAKLQLLTELATTIALQGQELQLNNFTWYGGDTKPTIDQFNRAWVDHVNKSKLPRQSTTQDAEKRRADALAWLEGAEVGIA